MAISPELRRLPKMIEKFSHDGLLQSLIKDLVTRDLPRRNFPEDMEKMLGDVEYRYNGLENLPTSGGLLVFNHPEVHIIAPAIFQLAVLQKKMNSLDNLSIVMGGEMPITKDIYLPFSPQLIKRFSQLYPESFILTPTYRYRGDYKSGRQEVSREIINAVRRGRLVCLAPEGQVSVSGRIQPVKVFHYGAGDLGYRINRHGYPIIPMGVWQTEDQTIHLNIGKPLAIFAPYSIGASVMMQGVAKLMPKELRGPFSV